MIRPWLARHVFYPAQDVLCGRDSLRYWKHLEHSQRWDPQQLRALQATKLRALVQQARAAPFYAQRFHDCGLGPSESPALEVLGRLPVLTKSDIRGAAAAMLTQPQGRGLISSCTSGSTGSPLIFQVDRRRCRSDVAARLRAHAWFDIHPGDPAVYLWGSRIELEHQDRLKALRDWLINEKLLNAFELNERCLHAYADTVRRIRPRSMYSYAGTAWRFASFVADCRPELHGAVQTVFATGEQLPAPWRADIIRALGSAVAEEYGCREGGLIAHECPAGSYHITAENVLVEILDDDGHPLPPGHEGDIVITNLEAYAMPFIRYATGDRGALGAAPCACGRTLPTMSRPTGRAFDFLITNDGTRVTGVSLSRDFKEIEGIVQYRIIQEEPLAVRIVLVINERFDPPAAERHMHRFVARRLGPRTELRLQYEAHLPPHRSGKYRYVVNALDEGPGQRGGASGC